MKKTGLMIGILALVLLLSMLSACKFFGKAPAITKECVHMFGEWQEEKRTSCDLPRKRERTCRLCGMTETETLSGGHTIVTDEAVAPGCVTDGLTEGSHCSVCGEITEKQEVIPAVGHTREALPAKEATCTEDGHTGGAICRTCGAEIEKPAPIAKKGHDYKLKSSEKNTCTKAGKEFYVCARCGGEYQKKLEAKGHSYSVEILKSSSCVSSGEKKYTCTGCGYSYTETVRATGHDYKTTTVAPTCESEGYTLYQCRNCSDSYKKNQTAALGHAFSDGVCQRCGERNMVDMRTRIGAPIGGEFLAEASIYSNDSYAFDFEAYNTSGKDIKYITFTLEFYNRVGDKVLTEKYKYTGPFKDGEVIKAYKDLSGEFHVYMKNITKKSQLSKLRIGEIELEYFDGTTECGIYGYESTEYKSKS